MDKKQSKSSRKALDLGVGKLSPFVDLRNAIIRQAVCDWEKLCALKRKRHSYNDEDISFEELVRFFLNDCNGLLVDTEIEGKDILEKLYLIPGAQNATKRIDNSARNWYNMGVDTV